MIQPIIAVVESAGNELKTHFGHDTLAGNMHDAYTFGAK